MTRFENPLRLVRELKGAPLSIYLVLMIQGSATLQELVAYTNYSENIVRSALTYMSAIQVARRKGRYDGWALMDGVMQLPLMADEGTAENEVPDPEILETSETAARTAESEVRTSLNEVPASSSSSLTNTRSLTNKEPLLARTNEAEIVRLLDQAGIRNPKRAEILEMQGISPIWIQGHLATAKSTGQAIYRILRRWNVPAGYQPKPGPGAAIPEEPGEPAEEDAETEQLWDQVREVLQGQLEQTIVRNWLPGARLAREGEDYLVICSNSSTRKILDQATSEPLRKAIEALVGRECKVTFVE
jgi:hypothetical protein